MSFTKATKTPLNNTKGSTSTTASNARNARPFWEKEGLIPLLDWLLYVNPVRLANSTEDVPPKKVKEVHIEVAEIHDVYGPNLAIYPPVPPQLIPQPDTEQTGTTGTNNTAFSHDTSAFEDDNVATDILREL
ncbi:hypothetical protein BGX26_001682 [Mortierella sp. AD094]|nr:hypothetical protein BGX26_001682 [Mortierella sp. AD094]